MLDKLCLFAHFDQDDLLADYVLYYLNAIRATGFEIVVISTSRLSAEDVSRLRSVAYDVLLRKNEGHDFASWSLGIERYSSSVSGQLMIANDSVYGPIGDLIQTLARLTSVPADVYGMIESAEIKRHLQSWLVIFEPHVHSSSAFRAVFSQQFHGMSKAEIIQNGEINLSQSLISQGYKIRSLFDGKLNNGGNLKILSNYSHFLWRELIELENIPFLKIELLRVNPGQIANLSAWKDVVEIRQPELVQMIESHLMRVSISKQKDGLSALHLPLTRGRSEHFVRTDYAHAREGRRILHKINHVHFLCRKLSRFIIRHCYHNLGRIWRNFI